MDIEQLKEQRRRCDRPLAQVTKAVSQTHPSIKSRVDTLFTLYFMAMVAAPPRPSSQVTAASPRGCIREQQQVYTQLKQALACEHSICIGIVRSN
jgi:hypothetical protein